MLVRGSIRTFSLRARADVPLVTDAGWIFAQHFCNRLGSTYLQLKQILDESDATHAEVLNNIKTRFREETFTRQSIMDVILAHPDLVGFPKSLGLTSS